MGSFYRRKTVPSGISTASFKYRIFCRAFLSTLTWSSTLLSTNAFASQSLAKVHFIPPLHGKTACGDDGRGDEFITLAAIEPPIHELQAHFEAHMRQSDQHNIFKDWETYKATLPVETSWPHHLLAEFPYWAKEEDLQRILDRLRKRMYGAKHSLGYIVAQARAGKSSCVIPAFLLSTKAASADEQYTHYVYLTFDKTRSSHFKSQEYSNGRNTSRADEHGAAFVLDVLKRNLLGKTDEHGIFRLPAYSGCIPIKYDAPKMEDIQDSIDALISSVFPEDANILFHIDDHGEMSENGTFRRGAIEALTRIPNSKCIATCVKHPLGDEPVPGMRRMPIPLPPLDLHLMSLTYPALDVARLQPSMLQNAADHENSRRQLETVQFQMTLCLHRYLAELHAGSLQPFLVQLEGILLSMHGTKSPNEAFSINGTQQVIQQYLNAFALLYADQSASSSTDDHFGIGHDAAHNEHALRLMNGYTDSWDTDVNERLCEWLAVVDDKIFASWTELMAMENDEFHPFKKAREEFVAVAALKQNDLNSICATPLERAYLWSLLCCSQQQGQIVFKAAFEKKPRRNADIIFKAMDFKFGRLLLGQDWEEGCMIDPTMLERDILYAVAEKGIADSIPVNHRTQTRLIDLSKSEIVAPIANDPMHKSQKDAGHPLCDLFFVTPNNQLVMIDIAGGDIGDKMNVLFSFLSRHVCALRATGINNVVGVILAPAMEGPSEVNESGSVRVICLKGEDARRHLGGLEQLYPW
eukprot:CAMPEP_0119556488 /NCGR_PEP_ID=MMETSP1352-20130426/8422_1 /TAXON_ID=265584 /ORGANISM="Stauroneis constricta, Strain CCMP1120" /LENGTH=751 /DNA_ID=CAMNT_0007603451 /DNA_START=1121 /DNA_END=3373 /DNA_ORIENTATION=-